MKILILTLLFLVACEETQAPNKPIEQTEPSEEVDLSNAKKAKLWATMYYMKEVEPSSSGVPLRNMKNEIIGPKLDVKTWCLGAIEGTVSVEGKTYNYAGTRSPKQANCSHGPSSKVRWKVSKYQYGIGNRNNPLRPFKSIAVDTSVIPNGTKVYIPQAKGVEYKFEGEKKIHNGVFYADDVGGAIKGNHIDVYIGSVKGGLEGALRINPFDFIKSSPSGTFEAYLLK